MVSVTTLFVQSRLGRVDGTTDAWGSGNLSPILIEQDGRTAARHSHASRSTATDAQCNKNLARGVGVCT